MNNWSFLLDLTWRPVNSMITFVLTPPLPLPLGLPVYGGGVCPFKPLTWVVQFYASTMRGTLLILQLMVMYFGPYCLFGAQISAEYRFCAMTIAFTINYTAYFAEIYHGGF